MIHRIRMEGRRYGYWTVLQYLGANENKQTIYLRRCDCGTMRVVVAQPLREGKTVSCGCMKPSLISVANHVHREPYIGYNNKGSAFIRTPQHFEDKDPEYRAWYSMKTRCSPDNVTMRPLYYDRGVRICSRWHDYENFLIDMGRMPRPGLTLNRINNDGHYEPGNCNWADVQEQAQNRRTSSEYKENIVEQREYEEYRVRSDLPKRKKRKLSFDSEDVGV